MLSKEQRLRSKLNIYCEFLNSADRLQDDIMELSDVMQKTGLIERADLDDLRDKILDLYSDIKKYCMPYLDKASLIWSELYDEEKC